MYKERNMMRLHKRERPEPPDDDEQDEKQPIPE